MFTALNLHIILPGLFQTIYLISISISLKNKGENEKSCWKFGKDCALWLQHISVYMESYCQITSQPDRSWCIKLIGCIWDKWFDLENIEKSVLNFGRFYTLSWSNCWNFSQWLEYRTKAAFVVYGREFEHRPQLQVLHYYYLHGCKGWVTNPISGFHMPIWKKKHFSKHQPELFVLTTVKHWCSVTAVSWREAASKQTHVSQHLIQKYTGNTKWIVCFGDGEYFR